jgi:hypothetical protein
VSIAHLALGEVLIGLTSLPNVALARRRIFRPTADPTQRVKGLCHLRFPFAQKIPSPIELVGARRSAKSSRFDPKTPEILWMLVISLDEVTGEPERVQRQREYTVGHAATNDGSINNNQKEVTCGTGDFLSSMVPLV